MYVKIILIVLVGALVVIQFIPVQKTNPPVTGEIDAPESVMKVFKTSCYDCHSNEVVWPWYSRVAPASWLVAYDVNEAREEYNFSEWSSYNAEERMDNREEIWEEVEEGHMPLWYYVLLHPEAKLSVEDKEIIKKWSEGRL
jgi:heme-binding protein